MFPLVYEDVKRSHDTGQWRPPSVLEGMDLEIHPGEIHGLLGPTGAGKTTCMDLAVGLLEPDAGSVRVYGEEAFHMQRETRCRLGYDSEAVVFPAKYRVREVLEYVKSTYSRWNAKRERELYNQYGLDPDAYVEGLSPGFERKLGIMTAVCHDPDLILLDESLIQLDSQSRRQTLDLLGELAADGRTAVLATHTHADMERIADRVAILHGGRIALEGRVDHLKESCFLLETTRRHDLPGTPWEQDASHVFISDCRPGDVDSWIERQDPDASWIGADIEKIYRGITGVTGERTA